MRRRSILVILLATLTVGGGFGAILAPTSCTCALRPEAAARPAVTDTSGSRFVTGDSLSTTHGPWVSSGNLAPYPNTAYSYQWEQCNLTGASCVNIRGASCRNSATGCRYTLARRDVGHTIRAVVTITTAGGSTSQASLPTQALSRAESPAWLGRFSGAGGCLAPSRHWSTSFVDSHVHCATDPLGVRHTVLEYDITNNDFPYEGDAYPRGDVKGPKMFFPGNDYYVSIPILIPNGYPLIPAGGWNMFAEVYGAPYDGSPTNALSTRNDLGDDKNHLVLGGYINGRERQVWYGPPVDGNWHTIILHIHFAIDTTGFFELWYDGVQQNLKGERPGTKRLYTPTMILNRTWDGTDGNFLDINSYRPPTVYSGTLTLYHGSPAVGRTLASVESTVCCGGAGP